MKTFSRLVILSALAAAIGGAMAQTASSTVAAPAQAAAPAQPDADFAQKHPRIAEVLGRLRNERERIAADLKAGKITEDQAEALMAKARRIHRQEIREVRRNDGSLTREEQERLNREEDRLSARIHHDVAKTADRQEDRAEHAEKAGHNKAGKK